MRSRPTYPRLHGPYAGDRRPDLVVLSGDRVDGESAPDVQSVRPICYFRSPSLPWRLEVTLIFIRLTRRDVGNIQIRSSPCPKEDTLRHHLGNHDDHPNRLSREAQWPLWSHFPIPSSEAGPADCRVWVDVTLEVPRTGGSDHSAHHNLPIGHAFVLSR